MILVAKDRIVRWISQGSELEATDTSSGWVQQTWGLLKNHLKWWETRQESGEERIVAKEWSHEAGVEGEL